MATPRQPNPNQYVTYNQLTVMLQDWLVRTRQDIEQTTLASLRADAYGQQINELHRLLGVALSNPRNASDPRTPTIQQLQQQMSSIQHQLNQLQQQSQQPPYRGGSRSRRI
jgi:hypothetical protein